MCLCVVSVTQDLRVCVCVCLCVVSVTQDLRECVCVLVCSECDPGSKSVCVCVCLCVVSVTQAGSKWERCKYNILHSTITFLSLIDLCPSDPYDTVVSVYHNNYYHESQETT